MMNDNPYVSVMHMSPSTSVMVHVHIVGAITEGAGAGAGCMRKDTCRLMMTFAVPAISSVM